MGISLRRLRGGAVRTVSIDTMKSEEIPDEMSRSYSRHNTHQLGNQHGSRDSPTLVLRVMTCSPDALYGFESSSQLPPEIWAAVFSSGTATDFLSLRATSKLMNAVVRQNQVNVAAPFLAPPTALDTLLNYVDGIRANTMDLNWVARDHHFAKLAEFPNLQTLTLAACLFMTSRGFHFVGGLTRLSKLSILSCNSLKGSDFGPIRGLKSLTVFRSIKNENFDDQSVLGLASLVKLEHVEVTGSSTLRQVSALRFLTALTTLSFHGCRMLGGDEVVENLTALTLHKLDLLGTLGIGDERRGALKKFSSLRKMKIAVSNRGTSLLLNAIAQLHLTSLELEMKDRSRVIETDFHVLSALRDLTTFALTSPTHKPTCLAFCPSLPKLSCLRITGKHFDNACLNYAEECGALERLVFTRTSVSPSYLRCFGDVHPSVICSISQ